MNSLTISNPSSFSSFSNKEKWNVVLLILLSFSGISVLTIGKAILTPFHLLIGFHIVYGFLASNKLEKNISIPLLLFMLYVLGINLLQYDSIRPTSVLYTLIFCVEATIFFNLLKNCRISAIIYALKLIIILYFINIFFGFCFDLIQFKSEFVLKFIKVYYEKGISNGRPMGFSSEPSYASFILSVSFLCYSHLTNHKQNRKSFFLFGSIVGSIILSKSAYGFIFLSVIALDWALVFYRTGDKLFRLIFPLITILAFAGIIFFLSNSGNEGVQRLFKFSSALVDNSVDGKAKLIKLQEADGSAFARIAPTYLLFNSAPENNFNFLLGEGAGASGTFLSTFLTGILVDEGRESVDTGIMPALIFDYGVIGSFLFLLFLIFTFKYLSFSFWLLFLLIIPNANINTQLIWFAIICYSFVSIATPSLRKN